MGPRGPSNPCPGLCPGPRAPGRGQEPPDSPGAVGGCWKDVAKKPPSPAPQPVGLPPASNRLTTSRFADQPSFWVRAPLPRSADPRPRAASKPRSSASGAAHLSDGRWGRSERAKRAGGGASEPNVRRGDAALLVRAPWPGSSGYGGRGLRCPSAQAPTSCYAPRLEL